MLRPIDVIFKHPGKKFTVIYQNGKLWQLPRLDFDGVSLAYKRAYIGSREQIFVAQNQELPADDLLLCSQLATIPLPAIVIGRNVDEFEQWWQQNSFNYRQLSAHAKSQQAQAKAQLNDPNQQTKQQNPTTTAASPNLSATLIENSNLTTHANTPIVSSMASLSTQQSSTDIFDQMLDDLTQNLR